MDKTQLKHRIVGAIVLVALGVIFIPMILTTDSDFTISETNIPAKPAALEQLADMQAPAPAPLPPSPAPQAQPVDEHTPEQPAAVSDAKPPAKPAAVPAPAETDTEPNVATTSPIKEAVTSTVNTDKDTRAWVVQVASFSEQDKAMALRDRLRKAKYPSFVESVTTSKSKLYRVRVGPVVRREHAEEWQKKIAREFKVPDALVMAHPG